MRGDWNLGKDRSLFAGRATYPETEAGLTRRVRAVYAGAAMAVSDGLALRVTGEYERRAASYIRRGLTVGMIWRPGR